ncbi:hypothetical protein Nmel_017812 [Mimus melanotis]
MGMGKGLGNTRRDRRLGVSPLGTGMGSGMGIGDGIHGMGSM